MVEGSKRARRQICPPANPEEKQSYATPKPPVRGRGRGRGRGGQAAAASSAASRGRGRGRGRGTKAKAASGDAGAGFHVAAIKAVRGGPPGKWEFLVSWEGYDDEGEDTWEPEEHLEKRKGLIRQRPAALSFRADADGRACGARLVPAGGGPLAPRGEGARVRRGRRGELPVQRVGHARVPHPPRREGAHVPRRWGAGGGARRSSQLDLSIKNASWA